MEMSVNIDFTNLEPFKSYLVQMTTHTDYIATKANKTVMEQRVLETHREFMKGLEK